VDNYSDLVLDTLLKISTFFLDDENLEIRPLKFAKKPKLSFSDF